MVRWLWGGFSVDSATLNRFFSLHFLFPFLIIGMVIVHLSLLHKDGSNNLLGIQSFSSKISFYPYFYVKDLFSFIMVISIFSLFVFLKPNLLGHPDNYIIATSTITPVHIVPEWYFLPFYALLRSIPNKALGVITMLGAIIILLLLPFFHQLEVRSGLFHYLLSDIFWFFIANFIVLG